MAAYLNRLLIRMLEPYVVPDPHSHSEASDDSSSSSDSEEDDPDAGLSKDEKNELAKKKTEEIKAINSLVKPPIMNLAAW